MNKAIFITFIHIESSMPNFNMILLFPTIEFVMFFILSFSIWVCIKQNQRLPALVLFNVIFYGVYSLQMLVYLFIWSFLLWLCGKHLKIRHLIIGFSIFSLGFWKAIDAKFLSFNNISTPLGVSFFTFQGLTYIFARMGLPKQKTEEHITSPWDFLEVFAFVGFFPTIFSGPILRAQQWKTSFNNPIALTQKTFSYAITLIAIGSFYKLCLSSIFHDYVALSFSNPAEENALNLLIGMYAYTFEIYHDFAGYSLMAIGISILYGFHIPPNFKQPYLSINIREFWQKWHISFSFWLRDYFYIALGGSKVGQLKHLRNSMIVMLVCGAWHGLSSNYIAWGLCHGLAVIFFHLVKDKIKIPTFLAWFITFNYIALTWIFFRSPTASIGFDYIFNLFNYKDYYINFSNQHILILLLFLFALSCQWMEKKFFSKEYQFKAKVFNPWFSIFLWSFIFIFILMISPSGMPPFIYFSY